MMNEGRSSWGCEFEVSIPGPRFIGKPLNGCTAPLSCLEDNIRVRSGADTDCKLGETAESSDESHGVADELLHAPSHEEEEQPDVAISGSVHQDHAGVAAEVELGRSVEAFVGEVVSSDGKLLRKLNLTVVVLPHDDELTVSVVVDPYPVMLESVPKKDCVVISVAHLACHNIPETIVLLVAFSRNIQGKVLASQPVIKGIVNGLLDKGKLSTSKLA